MSRQFRVAVIGAGIGAAHVEAYRANAALYQVAVVCDLDAERANKVAAKAGAAMATSYDAVLAHDDIDLIEMNEAFAAVVLRFVRDMGVPIEKVNVNGGAIAMGHPLGATGAMILGTLIDELERTGGRYGLATLCIGGGMGIATVIERV